MASSQGRSKDTEMSPYPKDRDRGNVNMVQIPETGTQHSSTDLSNPFLDTAIRRAFIIKVFAIISAQLFFTAGIITVFVFSKDLKMWVIANPLFIYLLFPAFFVIIFVLACCEDQRRQVPANYILLGFFTLIQGLLLGGMSAFYSAEEILWTIGATTVVTLALTIFALQTKLDFTLLNGLLFVFFLVLLIFLIITIIVRTFWLRMLYACLGTVLFSMYLVMDVQLMVGGHYIEIHPEEYVFAALNIYLDIVNIFLFMLQLVTMAGSCWPSFC